MNLNELQMTEGAAFEKNTIYNEMNAQCENR
jgi:hypothetical protein